MEFVTMDLAAASPLIGRSDVPQADSLQHDAMVLRGNPKLLSSRFPLSDLAFDAVREFLFFPPCQSQRPRHFKEMAPRHPVGPAPLSHRMCPRHSFFHRTRGMIPPPSSLTCSTARFHCVRKRSAQNLLFFSWFGNNPPFFRGAVMVAWPPLCKDATPLRAMGFSLRRVPVKKRPPPTACRSPTSLPRSIFVSVCIYLALYAKATEGWRTRTVPRATPTFFSCSFFFIRVPAPPLKNQPSFSTSVDHAVTFSRQRLFFRDLPFPSFR